MGNEETKHEVEDRENAIRNKESWSRGHCGSRTVGLIEVKMNKKDWLLKVPERPQDTKIHERDRMRE